MALPFAAQVRPPLRQRVPAQRLFVALWPDAGARAQLAKVAATVAVHGRAVNQANLHLTLVFLGQVEVERQASAARAMRAAAGTGFDLTLDRFGYFSASRVLWLGSTRPPPELPALRARLAEGMGRAGFALERGDFKAHVTLMRDCAGPASAVLAEPMLWRVRRLALVRSTPARGGSRYALIDSHSLG